VGALAVQWIVGHKATKGDTPSKFRAHGDLFSYIKTGEGIFIRPLVFMNESGRAVREAMHTFDAKPKDIVVIHDDSDLPIGGFKHTDGGGSAGHNGIRSIIDHLHTEDFARIRIGIREPNEAHRKKAGDFVLSPITLTDKKTFERVFSEISDSLLFESG
jgi:PTH1 family peptidyl-tRNA hydrolase